MSGSENRNQFVIPTEQGSRIAEESCRLLSTHIHDKKKYKIIIIEDGDINEPITLPASAVNILLDALTQIAEGNALSLVSLHKELTTQEAADILNVSRPYLVKLLEEGNLPFHKVGTKRRVLAKDVLDYKNTIDEARHKTLEKLAEQAQELNMGYDVD